MNLFGSVAIYFFVKREVKHGVEERAQEVDWNEHWAKKTETRDARQHTVDNWYFDPDTSRLAPLSLLTSVEHLRITRSYTIYATIMLELTVSDGIYHTCSLFTEP